MGQGCEVFNHSRCEKSRGSGKALAPGYRSGFGSSRIAMVDAFLNEASPSMLRSSSGGFHDHFNEGVFW